jgi:chromosome segregation ATPase
LLYLLAWVFLACGVSPAKADTVTLNSGEVLEGRILSETDTQLVIEASFYHGTILSMRDVLKSEIQSVVRESLEEKHEKADYAALGAYALNPNQELAKGQYDAGITAFEKFLTTYTNSSYAADINHRLADWRAEVSNIESGKVKFAGTWMTPDEKKAQAELARRQADVSTARDALQLLKRQLAGVQAQRAAQAEKLAAAQKELADAQSRLANIPDTSGSGSGSAGNQGGRRDLAGRLTAGVVGVSQGEATGEPVSNPERSQVQAEVNSYQQRVTHEQGALTLLNAKIADLQSQILPREQEYNTSLAQLSGITTQRQASAARVPPAKADRPSETNAPAKTAQPPALPQEQTPPWYMRAWKWFHG